MSLESDFFPLNNLWTARSFCFHQQMVWMDSSSRQRHDTAKNEKQVRRSRQKRHNTVWVSKICRLLPGTIFSFNFLLKGSKNTCRRNFFILHPDMKKENLKIWGGSNFFIDILLKFSRVCCCECLAFHEAIAISGVELQRISVAC
jgi:hypothetical protein